MVRFYVVPFLALSYVAFAGNIGTPALYATLPLLAVCFAICDIAFGATPPVAVSDGDSFGAHLVPWLYIPLQIAVTISGAVAAAHPDSGLTTIIGLALAIGTVAGIFGMLAAHEMIHSPRPLERAWGLVMLASTTYMHFRLSHIRTHHRLAGTMADPATARRDESAYHFVLRSVIGQFRAACEGERERPFATNRVYRYIAISAALYLAIVIAWGFKAVIFFALQSIVAVFILEIFNYVVHYGLQRRILPNGRPEPFSVAHSWNASPCFTNWALMNGGHHSDHHRRPTHAYPRLSRDADAPELPLGYAGTMAMALVPPLWRAVMHPRLDRMAAREAW
ncbi:MAG TPA: alkane 1-monooxygenase [Stellaceae bacterium]|jgi:alkane 1-monooxygenase